MTRKEQLAMLGNIANILVQQDSILNRLNDIEAELLTQRRLAEGELYGVSAEDSEEVDLDDIPMREVEDDG